LFEGDNSHQSWMVTVSLLEWETSQVLYTFGIKRLQIIYYL